jgi:AmmeMemoRadiSam system protein A
MTDRSPDFTETQRAELLLIARRAICERVRGLGVSDPNPDDPALRAPGAAFVTLTRAGSLRGCIGYVQAIRPLAETIAHCAASAATSDPRFPAVAASDLPHLHLEISVLSPLRRILDPGEIQVGVHGLHISKDDRHGLLLPQVATDYGWDRDTFLRQVCIKAGLASDAWRRGAEIQVFTVERIADGLPVEAEPQ